MESARSGATPGIAPYPSSSHLPRGGIGRGLLSTAPALALLLLVVVYRVSGVTLGAIPLWQGRLPEGGALAASLDGLSANLNAFMDAVRPHLEHLLVVLFAVCGVTVTALRAHISLRPVRTRLDDRLAEGFQLAAHLFLVRACLAKLGVETPDQFALWKLWIATFSALALANAVHLARPLPRSDAEHGFGKALLAVPLHAWMGVISAAWFLSQGAPSGLAIYLKGITDQSDLYVQVPLYVWAGLMLKRTRLAARAFEVVRPLGLSPELLAAAAVAAAAIPTAYSGASGIFVMAAGGLMYQELRRAGASQGLAMASTAMSGSLGVVLRPCLLVFIVAMISLNGDVTATQLYCCGGRVYLLTAVLFAAFVLASRKGTLRARPEAEAGPKARGALAGIVPYLALGVAVVLGFRYLLDTRLDELTAPMMIPLVMLVLMGWERRQARRERTAGIAPDPASKPAPGGLFAATADTAELVGALLLLMGLSTCLGGVVQEAEITSWVPEQFSSPVQAMSLLLIALVAVGMTMDPYGAVILVNATLKAIADRAGIDPVHFWMTVLVAFELGYLTPPVALNQLLAAQVVGDRSREEGGPTSRWGRHERYVLPMAVLGVALLLVAYLPFAFPGLLGCSACGGE